MADNFTFAPTSVKNYTIDVTASDAFISKKNTLILEVQSKISAASTTISVIPNTPQLNLDSGK